MEYTPDSYSVLLIDNSIIKIYASWTGSFASGDAYRLNSGVESIVEKENYYLVFGYSGSVYKLYKNKGRMNAYCQGILNKLLEEPYIKEISIQEAIEFLKESE